jgi:hypothetical protein
MWGNRKVLDFVPDMEGRRARSLEHLKSLATSVVKEVLGMSPQEKAEIDETENYEQRLEFWRRQQAELNKMNNEEYEQAIREGYVTSPPERYPKKKEVDLNVWLQAKVREKLLGKIDSVLLDLIGIEHNYGSPRLKPSGGGLAGSRLAEKAKQLAVELADKWVAEHGDKAVKELSGEEVARKFKYDLETETKKAVVAKIAAIAVQRADYIRTEVLEAAVDHAMFENYPILRRMEAASRLDAKTEKPDEDAA